MFSYRHAFHAGNHADVLKHITLLVCIELLQKKVGLTFIDTHAGAGIYDLNDEYAQKSAEALEGIMQLQSYFGKNSNAIPTPIQTYIKAIAGLNAHPLTTIRYYPGSSQLMLQALRDQDKLRLMELHPNGLSNIRRKCPCLSKSSS
jgi:23S rRNA (adenine2030-N6)-methyltransferase